jgi:hypothetical protein
LPAFYLLLFLSKTNDRNQKFFLNLPPPVLIIDQKTPISEGTCPIPKEGRNATQTGQKQSEQTGLARVSHPVY